MQTFVVLNAQNTRKSVKHQLLSDTVNANDLMVAKSDAFYDTLQQREYKSWISRTLARLLIAGRNSDDSAIPNEELEKSQTYFEQYAGLTISAINIVQANVFEQNDLKKEKWIDRFVNSLHVLTNERQLRQNVLFKVGNKINPYELAINEKLIRNLPYISTAFFIISEDPNHPNQVIVNIFARDNWTISANASVGSTPWLDVYDKNFIGTGNQLALRYYPHYGNQGHGFESTYSIDNLWGTFANVDISLGVGSTNNKAMVYASRPFILPSDHIFGIKVGYEQVNRSMTTFDTIMLINRLDYGFWYGYSFNLDSQKGTNSFVTMGADMAKFHKRPKTAEMLNPLYHDRITALVSFGVAQQNFFQGNMIYGYGRTEDIPYGFKFDATFGLQWSEYYPRRYYLAGSAAWGNITKTGYYNVVLGASTFIDDNRKSTQSQADIKLRYFSPLFRAGNHYLRQFVNISSMWGFGRFIGEKEMISYHDVSSVRGVATEIRSKGYNRFVVNSELVWFTPIFLYHFRFAFNTWGDVGWLGYKKDVFANPLSSALGLGVRIKNERLIFNSISIRFGYALRLPSDARFNPFQITNEQTLNIQGFEPKAPMIREYQ